jgi:DNA-binding transcriptional LysR family regulator
MLNEIDLSRVDLNLLVLFETVLKERHVARAAQRLHLSPSAVSHGMRRLRETFNDPLFLRHPKGVVPTARALSMADPVEQILARVRQVIANADAFDPTQSKRTFVVGAPDALAVVALPAVLATISKQAPGVSVSVRDLRPADTIAALDARQIDVALYPLEEVPARFEARFLYDEEFAVAARADHSFGKRLSLDAYCSARHLLVSRSGDAHGFVDDLLEQRGRSRSIVLIVPSFMFAMAALATTDMVGTLPRSLLRMHAKRFGLAILEPPVPLIRSKVYAMTSKVAMMDLGIAWLMELLQRQLSQQVTSRRRR